MCVFAAASSQALVSSDSVAAVDNDDDAAEMELQEGSTKDKKVDELWMDFDVLCRCFRSDSLGKLIS